MDLKSPTTMMAAWLLAPALVVLACAGLGLGIERLSGRRPGVLTLPLGFAAGIVVISFALEVGISGRVAAFIALALAIAGGVAAFLRMRGHDRRLQRARALTSFAWPAGAGLAAYALFLAPLVGSGRLGVLGYALNNDTAVHISGVELLTTYGTGPYTLEASSFAQVGTVTGSGYPLGSYAWYVFAHVTTGLEPFHLWVPLIAVGGAMAALVAFSLLRDLMGPVPAAFASVAASCGFLPFSYMAQGGAKEVFLALCVYLTVALFVQALRDGFTWRTGIPVGVAAGSAIAVLGLGAVAWLGPPGLVAVAALLWTRRSAPVGTLLGVGAAVVVASVMALPALIASFRFVRDTETVLTNPAQVGNLVGAIPLREVFNVWFAYDYRFPDPLDPTLTDLGVLAAAALALAGVVYCIYRRLWGVPLAVAAGLSGAAIVSSRYAIYFDAKAYMALAPAIGLATAAGVVWLYRSSIRNQGLAVATGALLVLAVLRSDFFVHQGAFVTPKDRFEELAQIDERFDGKGPMLVNEREDYAKYLLRHVRPFESWGPWTPDRGILETETYNPRLDPAHTPDFDDYAPDFVGRFPLLLERKRPGGSAPPAGFSAVHETPTYRVWRRIAQTSTAHVGLGARRVSGAARLDCSQPAVAELMRRSVAERVPLAAALPRPAPVTVLPGGWAGASALGPGPGPNYTVRRGGVASVGPDLPPGSYTAYVQGSFGPGVRVSVNGRPVGDVFGDLQLFDAWHELGQFTAPGGELDVAIVGLGKPAWQSGSRRTDISGRLAFVPQPATPRIATVPPERARSLCGKRLDWLELGGPGTALRRGGSR